MLKRVYADNYRCFQNFEVKLGEITLLMGDNGSGKSTLLHLLRAIRSLVSGGSTVTESFPASSLCRWDTRPQMRFELTVDINDPVDGGPLTVRYGLEVDHDVKGKRARILKETLSTDQGLLFCFQEGVVSLHRDDYSTGPEYSADWTRSALSLVAERGDNRRLTAFQRFVRNCIILRMVPSHIQEEARSEDQFLDFQAGNFPAWYRYLSQEHQDHVFDLTQHLREVRPGFRGFLLSQVGREARELMVRTQSEDGGNEFEFPFSELSDGERALLVLNTLLRGVPPERHALFIDEPTNYVGLSEIQPWLMELADLCGERVPQAVLVSHHPEVLDCFGAENGIVFSRAPNSPTRIRRGLPDDETGLTISERVALGWADG